MPADRESAPDPLLKSGSFIFSTPGNSGTYGNEIKRRPNHQPNGPSGSPSDAGISNGVNLGNPMASAVSKTKKRGETPENWLPPGWTVEDRVRTSGATAGITDKYYYDPTGRKFRSKTEVMYFLEHGTLSKRPKRAENSDPSDSQGNNKDNKTAKMPRASFYFDYLNVPEEISWVLTNASDESWEAFIGDKKVPESSTQDWAAAFTMFTTRYG